MINDRAAVAEAQTVLWERMLLARQSELNGEIVEPFAARTFGRTVNRDLDTACASATRGPGPLSR